MLYLQKAYYSYCYTVKEIEDICKRYQLRIILIISWSLYRKAAKALSRFVVRSHVYLWKWIQKYWPERIYLKKRGGFWIYNWWNTQIKVGQDFFWIWIAIEPDSKIILGLHISFQRNMFVAEQFLSATFRKEVWKISKYQLIPVLGILMHVNSQKLGYHFILCMKRASWRELISICFITASGTNLFTTT